MKQNKYGARLKPQNRPLKLIDACVLCVAFQKPENISVMSCNTSLTHWVMQVRSLLTFCVVHWNSPVMLTNLYLILLVWLACWLGVRVCCFHNLKYYIEMEMTVLSIFCASRFYFQDVLTCSTELRCIKSAHNIWSLRHSFLSPCIFIYPHVVCATNWLLRYLLNPVSDSYMLIVLPLTHKFSGNRNYREKSEI